MGVSGSVVIDASLAVKWLVEEDDSDKAHAALQSWVAQDIARIAPHLIPFEVANALYRRVLRGELNVGDSDCMYSITWSGAIGDNYSFDANSEVVGLSRVVVEVLPVAERTAERNYRVLGPAHQTGSASDHIIKEVDRLRGLVTDLDWLAETDHGELRLSLEASSIYELVSAEVDRWQPQSQARRVELSLEASADLPDMDIDRMRMSQALGNVLSNSLLCTQAGGSILLRAGLKGDEALAISITDNGIGIHAADLSHVFDRFYRTDQSRSRGIGGTGLGLAITRAIVEAHGGTVTIRSDGLGQGVTVILRLPLTK